MTLLPCCLVQIRNSNTGIDPCWEFGTGRQAGNGHSGNFGPAVDHATVVSAWYRKFAQQYGRFEIRCRVPKGKGLWPAFWLLPDPLAWPPEIDVLETLGHEPNKAYFTHHFRDEQRQRKSGGGSWTGPDFTAGFHEFAVEWSPERIVWFVDGIERFKSEKSIPNARMYMLVNLAVGGGWPGSPDETTQFPAALGVDYVRVYEKAP